MKRLTLLSILFLLCSMARLTAQPKYEVRAVWLTTIGGIDWPRTFAHDRFGIIEQKRQLTDILDRLQQAGINTVLLQTRVRATTIYPSETEPWDGCLSGKPGQSPGYDALQFAIDECHRRGMELHAWVVTIPVGKWTSYGCQQLRKHYPKIIMKIGDEGYMNPEALLTADYIAEMCEEITKNYDVDGIHLDYIRYPETWKGKKNPDNITRIVRRIHQSVKRNKPWVKISCSPIGKYDDLSRYSSKGWNARRQVAQDAQRWLHQGLMDQLYPMMYFQGNNFYPFAIDWQENSLGRSIAAGLGVYMLHPKERNWPLEEIQRQLNVTRQIGLGHCYFRAKFLLDNVKGVYDLVRDFDRQPALVPPITWTKMPAPKAPDVLEVRHTIRGDEVSWSGAQDLSNGPYLLYNIYASEQYPVDTDNPANLIAVRHSQTSIEVKRASGSRRPVSYAVTAVDRYGNESTATQEPVWSTALPAAFLPNDGRILTVSSKSDADFLAILTMQGRIVYSCRNQAQINIQRLKDGVYELRSLNKKGIMHRLGFFIIKRNQSWKR